MAALPNGPVVPQTIEDNPFASEPDETTALLHVIKTDHQISTNEASIGASSDDGDDKPLPRTQIFLLCYARIVEPIAFFGIFPFINKMIWETGGLREADVGFYSGLIESLFSLTQMLLMILWGHVADRLGRKPVLVFSLAGMSIGTALFGLSKTIWQMVLFRCLAGVFAGSVVTIRAMISENSTHKTQARAFSFFAFTGNLGIFIGPLIGGALADPAGQYPRVFGGVHFFKEFPYVLPTLFSGLIGASAAIICWLFLKETLEPKAADKSSEHPPMSLRELLTSPGVPVVLLLTGYIMNLAFAYTAVIPVFFFTDVALGGYGFSPLHISLFMALGGFAQSIWLLLLFPPLQRRFGTGGVLRGCAVGWPILFFLVPAGNLFLRRGWNITFWIVAPMTMAIGHGVAMAYTAIQLALNDVAPSPATLGMLNAVALTFTSGIRACAPAAFASLFATGARTQILDGYLVWLVLIVLGLALTPQMRWLPEKAEGRLKCDANSDL